MENFSSSCVRLQSLVFCFVLYFELCVKTSVLLFMKHFFLNNFQRFNFVSQFKNTFRILLKKPLENLFGNNFTQIHHGEKYKLATQIDIQIYRKNMEKFLNLSQAQEIKSQNQHLTNAIANCFWNEQYIIYKNDTT